MVDDGKYNLSKTPFSEPAKMFRKLIYFRKEFQSMKKNKILRHNIITVRVKCLTYLKIYQDVTFRLILANKEAANFRKLSI